MSSPRLSASFLAGMTALISGPVSAVLMSTSLPFHALRGDFAGKSTPRSTVKWVSKTVKNRTEDRKPRLHEP
jgi:hypothetical protein